MFDNSVEQTKSNYDFNIKQFFFSISGRTTSSLSFSRPRSLRGILSPSLPEGYFISLIPCGVFHLPCFLRGISSPSFPAGYFISLVLCRVFYIPHSLQGISSPSLPAGYFISLVSWGVFHLTRSLWGGASLRQPISVYYFVVYTVSKYNFRQLFKRWHRRFRFTPLVSLVFAIGYNFLKLYLYSARQKFEQKNLFLLHL